LYKKNEKKSVLNCYKDDPGHHGYTCTREDIIHENAYS